jgi:hypothetical protein
MQWILLLDKIEWDWWLQQNDAAATMLNSTMATLVEIFGDHVI